MRLIFVGQGYPRKLFNLGHFLMYGTREIATQVFGKQFSYDV